MMRRQFDPHKCQDVKPWVIAAINDESRYPPDRLWKKEPTAEFAYHERLKRIKFLRKYSKTDPKAAVLAHRLETCELDQRCLSGACPECGRLFQRWFVRRSKKFIAKHISRPKQELVAVSIVPWTPIVRPGQLLTVDVVNLQRRLKYTLKKADLDVACFNGIRVFGERQGCASCAALFDWHPPPIQPLSYQIEFAYPRPLCRNHVASASPEISYVGQ
jgi:hypothetical protein